ncbi:hypothetical protein [Kordiimonas sp.]
MQKRQRVRVRHRVIHSLHDQGIDRLHNDVAFKQAEVSKTIGTGLV